MAKAVITFRDNEAGTVDVQLKFSPPVKPRDPGTPAQLLALEALKKLKADQEHDPETPAT